MAVITGTGFGDGATVTFGGTAATSVVVVDSTHITCLTPAHALGLVDVKVTNIDGLFGTLTNGYRYVTPVWANDDQLIATPASPGPDWTQVLNPLAPEVDLVVPDTGVNTGGDIVEIVGDNFIRDATVTIGGVNALNVVVNNKRNISCITPAHAVGAVNIIVTNPDLQTGTLIAGFTYILPELTLHSVTPIEGTTAGGTSLTILGTNFVAGATVTVGNLFATSVSVVNAQTITCLTPEHTAGVVDIEVLNP